MDKDKKPHKERSLEQEELLSRKESGQQNLEAVQYDKHDSLDEEIISKRRRHKNQEIELDESDLSEMERELINSLKDWGEQTIDYKKIRAGKEGITVDRSGDDSIVGLNISEQEIESKPTKSYKGIILDGDTEETPEEVEGEEIIHPDSKGIESIILILNSYFQKDILPSDVLKRVAQLTNKERGFGVVSFFYRNYNSEDFSEILNGHSIYSSSEKSQWWEEQKEKNINTWKTHKLPFWSDSRFQEKEISFVYPYFEGIDHMGFAVVSFANGMKEENSPRIEVALEASRAVYLSQRHKENGDEAIYNERIELPKEELKAATPKAPEAVNSFMGAKDNLILLEKKRAQREKELAAKKKEEGPVKKLWKRMFG